MPELKLKKSMKPRKGGSVVLNEAPKKKKKNKDIQEQNITEDQQLGDDDVS